MNEEPPAQPGPAKTGAGAFLISALVGLGLLVLLTMVQNNAERANYMYRNALAAVLANGAKAKIDSTRIPLNAPTSDTAPTSFCARLLSAPTAAMRQECERSHHALENTRAAGANLDIARAALQRSLTIQQELSVSSSAIDDEAEAVVLAEISRGSAQLETSDAARSALNASLKDSSHTEARLQLLASYGDGLLAAATTLTRATQIAASRQPVNTNATSATIPIHSLNFAQDAVLGRNKLSFLVYLCFGIAYLLLAFAASALFSPELRKSLTDAFGRGGKENALLAGLGIWKAVLPLGLAAGAAAASSKSDPRTDPRPAGDSVTQVNITKMMRDTSLARLDARFDLLDDALRRSQLTSDTILSNAKAIATRCQ